MHIPRAHLLNPGMNLQQHSSILLRELTFIFTKEGVKPNMGYFILSPKVRADPRSTSPTKSQQYEKGYSSLQNNLFCSIAQMMGGESIPHWTTSLYFIINELYTLTTFLYIANHCQPVSCAWLLRAWMLQATRLKYLVLYFAWYASLVNPIHVAHTLLPSYASLGNHSLETYFNSRTIKTYLLYLSLTLRTIPSSLPIPSALGWELSLLSNSPFSPMPQTLPYVARTDRKEIKRGCTLYRVLMPRVYGDRAPRFSKWVDQQRQVVLQ